MEGTEDVINGMQCSSEKTALVPLGLGYQQNIINVHVGLRDRCRRWTSKLCVVVGQGGGNQNLGVIRWWRVGSGLQTVFRELSIVAHGSVRKVTCCFREHGEVGRALHPAHRESEWESNEGLATLTRQHNAQLRDIGESDVHAIEAISNVFLSQFGRPKPRVGMHYTGQRAVKRAPKLQSFGGSHTNCFRVDIGERRVNNEPWPVVPLGDHTEWRETEVVPRAHHGQRENKPIPLLAKFKELFTNKIDMGSGGLVRAAA